MGQKIHRVKTSPMRAGDIEAKISGCMVLDVHEEKEVGTAHYSSSVLQA